MGQLFYSMSLAMGIMITYGSYMKKENNLESSVRQIEIFDTDVYKRQPNLLSDSSVFEIFYLKYQDTY